MAGWRGPGALGLVLLALLAAAAPAHADTPLVETAQVSDVINSVSADYIAGVVQRAEADHAAALVLLVNTPGGISTAMDDIVTSLLNSTVPVIAYVTPAGGRADSAGLFVVQACDLVAMAPGTNIGSAHPISSSGADLGGDLGRKVLNDAVARVRSLASEHGRNADWAESAVRQSVNISAQEAVSIHVADLLAKDLPALLAAVDGRTLSRPHGGDLRLAVAGARVEDHPMGFFQQLMHSLIDPNIAFLLLLVAAFGLIAEVTSPGAIFPGVVGGLSAILALVALSSLPLNLAGIVLLGFAFALFLIDIKAQTHGILTVGGLVALVLGAGLLINTGPVGQGVDPWVIAAAAALTLAIFGFVIRKAASARSTRSFDGAAALLGTLGEARGAIDPDGEVFVAGALWKSVLAEGAAAIAAGATVRVTGRRADRLEVEGAPAGPGGRRRPG